MDIKNPCHIGLRKKYIQKCRYLAYIFAKYVNSNNTKRLLVDNIL